MDPIKTYDGPTSPQQGLIFRAIPLAMSQMEAVAKSRNNAQQGFKYRGIDDIYNELHSILANVGVFTVPKVLSITRNERAAKTGGVLMFTTLEIEYKFYAVDGSFIEAKVIGEGMDSGDKSSNKAMAVAHKYALLQVFAIPTEDDKDPDAQSHEVKPKEAAQPVKPISTPKPKAETKPENKTEAPKEPEKPKTLGDTVMSGGPFGGMTFRDIWSKNKRAAQATAENVIKAIASGKEVGQLWKDFLTYGEQVMNEVKK
jgi:hypothetical protein